MGARGKMSDLWLSAMCVWRKHTIDAANWLQESHPKGFQVRVLTTCISGGSGYFLQPTRTFLYNKLGIRYFHDIL